MSSHRPHAQTVRLTEAQHVLTRQRMVTDGMSWQRLLSACVNAYARGELVVDAAGVVALDEPNESVTRGGGLPESSSGPVICSADDPEAMDLDDLDAMDPEELDALLADTSRAYGSQAPRTIGTRELAERAEAETGRRVSLPLLRELVRERWPQDDEPGPHTRYRWDEDDPEVDEIIDAIAHGALDDVRDRRMTGVVLDG